MPILFCSAVGKLSLYSGVLALGVGDTMAAVAGSLMGKTKWPGMDQHVTCVAQCIHGTCAISIGTRKTVEGSMMSVLTQLLVVIVIVIIGKLIL